MKSKYYIIGGAIVVVIALVVFSLINFSNLAQYNAAANQNNLGTSGNSVQNTAQNGEVQEVRLYMKDFNYVTEPTVLKKGIPVRMTADLKTVVGCAQDVVIKDFGVRKYVKQGDNVIEFTPTKTGTIAIACSMNMFHGTFQVVDDANPNSAPEVTTSAVVDKSTSSGSCGMASGGSCGCGMKKL